MARLVLISMLNELYGDTVEMKEAKNGRDLLEVSRSWHPDIALVDIKMPEMDGLKAISDIRSVSPMTQCIVVSGYSDFSYAQEAVSLDAVAYLLKPVSTENLEWAVYRAKNKLEEYKTIQAANQDREKPEDSMIATLANIHVYLEEHYHEEEMSVKKAAEDFGITPNYLSSLFNKKYGCGFVDYLTQVRIRHAQEMLSEKPWLSIGQVASRVGYGNSRYFSKRFKEITGYLPSEFSKMMNR